MVKGLDTFKNYFEAFADNYIIIGGTACDIIISNAGLTSRTTKDIDIILVVEALSPEFVKKFWSFVKDGDYEKIQQNQQERKYYRFSKPSSTDFPYQIELFSRVPDMLTIEEGIHLTPIPIDEDISSLSAILMDDNYYNYTKANSTIADGIHNANTEALICLKVRAFLDLSSRKEKGERIDDREIRKHKADVFRLASTLTEANVFNLPEPIMKDLLDFVKKVDGNLPDNNMFKEMGLRKIDPKNVFNQLKASFQIR